MVHFPKAYDRARDVLDTLPPETGLQHVALLIQVLARYLRDTQSSVFRRDATLAGPVASFAGGPEIFQQLDAAIHLREDYLRNGPFFSRRTTTSTQRSDGRIDWSATLAQRLPTIESGDLYFLDFERRRRAHDATEFLHRLHATVTEEIAGFFGEYAGAGPGLLLDDFTYDDVRRRPSDYLDGLSSRVFSDRGLLLLALLKTYLGGGESSGEATAEFGCSTTAFELVWEQMVRELLMNPAGKAMRLLSRGAWTAGSEDQSGGIRPIADLLRAWDSDDEHETRYLLLGDAKDKPIAPNVRSGSEGDHYKQILYAQLIDVGEFDVFENVLIFPRVDLNEAADSPLFRHLGTHSWTGLDRSTVREASIDYVRVAEWYVGKRSVDVRAELAKWLRSLRGRP